jgi:hypothetical protein
MAAYKQKRISMANVAQQLGLKSSRKEITNPLDLPEDYIQLHHLSGSHGTPATRRLYSLRRSGQGRFILLRPNGTKRGYYFIHREDAEKVVKFFEQLNRQAEAEKAKQPPPQQDELPLYPMAAVLKALSHILVRLDAIEKRIGRLEKHQPRTWRVCNAIASELGVDVKLAHRPSVDELLGADSMTITPPRKGKK